MKHMKIAALVMAATMALSPMAVMADTIDGEVNYVDQVVYKVKLPTTAGMSFTLDPQGLSTLDNGGTYDSGEAGKIVSTGKMIAKNLSSVAVNLNADFYITDTADTPATLVASGNPVDDTKKEIQLIISTTDSTTNEIYVTGNAPGSGTDFTMAKANYAPKLETDGSYSYAFVDGGSTLEFTIGGTIAKNYDWSEYTGDSAKKITLNAVFEFTDTVNKTDGNPTEITPERDSAPSISTTAYDLTAGSPLAVTLDFGEGSLAATGVSKITTTAGTSIPTQRYKVVGNTLTFDETFTTNNASAAASGLKLNVVFNDTANTSVQITLTTATTAEP